MGRGRKIKVTIITGFLGAGKTTFINHILGQNASTQFALVENEFGDVAIDSKLIKGVDASQMFELKKGCICCTISDEFELVLQELAERFPNVEHLLIETTGVADPASVVRPFFSDEKLKNIYQYNGTVCLVDALNFGQVPEKELAAKQVVTADLLLMSKTATLMPDQKHRLLTNLRKQNPFANIQEFTKGQSSAIAIEGILKKQRSEFDFVGFSVPQLNISAKSLRFDAPVHKVAFLRWLEYTLDIYKKQIYRCKGILQFQNEPFEFVLQGVGGGFEIVEGDLLVGGEKCEIVFIGKLDAVELDFH